MKHLKTDTGSKNKYYNGLGKNYIPKDNLGNEIGNIKKYIQHDEEGDPYTDKYGAAIFNKAGGELLGRSGWRIEAKDVFHEENGNPVVKLVHIKGGEQIYDMISGEIVTKKEFCGTFNKYPGPYSKKDQCHGHTIKDVIPWIRFGNGQKDNTRFLSRIIKVAKASVNNYGSKYRNIKKNELEESNINA